MNPCFKSISQKTQMGVFNNTNGSLYIISTINHAKNNKLPYEGFGRSSPSSYKSLYLFTITFTGRAIVISTLPLTGVYPRGPSITFTPMFTPTGSGI